MSAIIACAASSRKACQQPRSNAKALACQGPGLFSSRRACERLEPDALKGRLSGS